MEQNSNYILAETMEERVAVVVLKFIVLWRTSHGPDEIPDVDTCKKFIKSAVWKEALTLTHGELHRLKDEVTLKREHNIARDIMLNNADIELKLKLERL